MEIKMWLSPCCEAPIKIVSLNAYCTKCYKKVLLTEILEVKKDDSML